MSTYTVYYLRPNGYVWEWSTVASSKEEAVDKFHVRHPFTVVKVIKLKGDKK